MPAAVRLRSDFSAAELRRLARKARDANQSRRLLSLAAVLDGKSRDEAATIGGMDRQTLRDWVHRFNAAGPDCLKDNWADGPTPRLSAGQKAELARIVETGPDRETDGVVRWRRVDLHPAVALRVDATTRSPPAIGPTNTFGSLWPSLEFRRFFQSSLCGSVLPCCSISCEAFFTSGRGRNPVSSSLADS